jgi:hypothetical protein
MINELFYFKCYYPINIFNTIWVDMKLKKLLSLDFMKDFYSLLETDFERKLFVASLRNYASDGNPLRFNNFSYSMRQLILCVIERKAPMSAVKATSWFVEPRRGDARKLQLKYCGQLNISDNYLGMDALDALNEGIGEFTAEFDLFNKYTHISEEYFQPCNKKFFGWVENVMKIAKNSLDRLDGLEDLIIELLEEKIRESARTTACESIPDDLAILARDVSIEYTEVDDIVVVSIDANYINVKASGVVYVTQEYGPRDDICEISMDYPFSLMMRASVTNPEDFTVTSKELNVDTSSWCE